MTNNVHEKHTTQISTPSDTEIRIERVFNARRELVWEAYTDPELMPEWLGPRSQKVSIQEMDVRPGGSYRYTSGSYVFFGEYREVVPPELLVSTFQWETNEHDSSVDRVEFEELDGGRTRIVVTASFTSKEQRDAMLQSDMERGVTEGYERLDELLASRQSRS